ncbi:MAG: hypothetical protein WBP22_01000 [Candidatus Saccharimonas sp.]
MFLRESNLKSDHRYWQGEWVISSGLKKSYVRYIKALNDELFTKPLVRAIVVSIVLVWSFSTVVAFVVGIVMLFMGSAIASAIWLIGSLISILKLKSMSKSRPKRVAKFRRKLGEDKFVSITDAYGIKPLFFAHQGKLIQNGSAPSAIGRWCSAMSADEGTREAVNGFLTTTALTRDLLATGGEMDPVRLHQLHVTLEHDVVLYAELINKRQRAQMLSGNRASLADPEIWQLNADMILGPTTSLTK